MSYWDKLRKKADKEMARAERQMKKDAADKKAAWERAKAKVKKTAREHQEQLREETEQLQSQSQIPASMPAPVECADVGIIDSEEEVVTPAVQIPVAGETETSVDYAVGLMTRYLFNNNFSDSGFTESDFYESYISSTSWEGIKKPDISDPLRATTGRFWNLSNDKRNITFLKRRLTQSPIELGFSENGRSVQISPNRNIALFGDSRSAFNTYRNLIEEWKDKTEDKWFYDHCFSSKIPVSKEVADKIQSATNVKQYNIRLNYNFYMSEYEDVHDQMPEQLLPNLYVMESAMQFEPDENRPDLTLNPKFEKHLTLNGAIELDGPISDMAGEYFDKYSQSVSAASNTLSLTDSFSNIFVSHSNVSLLSNYNSKKELFPMHVDIEFSTDTRTEFSELLKDTDMGCVLMKNVATEPAVTVEPFEEFIESTGAPVVHASATPDRRYIDITDWFDGVANIDEENAEDFEGVFLGTKREMVDDSSSQIQRIISSIILNGKLKKLKDSKTRTFEDIMEGKLANSETIMYRIQKISNGRVVQNFYLPNSNDIDVHKFVDTQVKYGKEYQYAIYAWELVYGTKYKYSMPTVQSSSARSVYAGIQIEPDVKIFEIPYASYTNRLLDSPSIHPNVEIIPFRGVNDRIKIHLSPNVGSYDLEPVFFDRSELDDIDRIMTSQHRTIFLDPMHYQTDDHATLYEIYRIEFHPSSYMDFKDSLIGHLNTDVEFDVPGSATSGAVIDSIFPNRKYWYTFRSLDNHENFSYPTPVYQVEIVDDNGVVYPLIKVVDFKKDDDKILLKPFKRMVHIEPSTAHTLLPESLEELDTVADKWDKPEYFKLGVAEHDLWGKKFKIRLTSKKTGKKIDMNVEFKNEHLKNEPE